MTFSLTRRSAIATLGVQLCMSPGTRADAVRPIVVASKSDTEGALVGQMIASALEAVQLPIERRLSLGPTLIVRTALLAGEVDIYPEYTGNGAFFSHSEQDPAWKNAATAFARIRNLDRSNGLVWLDRAPANNTWVIAVNGAFARAHDLHSMQDFARVVREDRIKLAASTEFVESPAALPSFEAAYGFSLPRSRIVSLPGGDTSVTARAAAERISGVNAGMLYGTGGALAALDLVPMTDTENAQIVYEVAPVVRAETLARYPIIADALNAITPGLDAETLRSLNARIMVEGEPAATVARRFLASRKPVR